MQVSSDRNVFKRVLVGVESINRPNRPVTSKDLENAIIKTFSDRLQGTNESHKELIIEIKDEEWDGLFVHLVDQVVADKSFPPVAHKIVVCAVEQNLKSVVRIFPG